MEPVFGQIKDVRGFARFMQRGIEACCGEWSLICATHNLIEVVAKREGLPELRKSPFLFILTCNFAWFLAKTRLHIKSHYCPVNLKANCCKTNKYNRL